ncbi:PIN domain-containing protein [Patescibacteria group bacterium]|nr:PIN domain-containing protein [Patescibacteria group bacterium]MCG2702042.1 PIN domain-containing protein [Candidatus Parcubacteria bacterium]MBU4265561.1 PIN domain-containing protein [Patescibacteria group bacterium]MBU4389890.1 PIN domain-containing protein [Patescibacteria group bacterium]MBU4397237.1 PIN domain-containing protein [Patescibacteria group bacterium]
MADKKLLVDSSIVIDYLRKGCTKKTVFYRLTRKYKMYVSFLIYAELFAGKSVWKKKEARNELEKILSGMTILFFDNISIAIEAGRIRAEHGLDLVDSVIASVAKKEKMVLATLNSKHFKKVKGLKLVDLKKI